MPDGRYGSVFHEISTFYYHSIHQQLATINRFSHIFGPPSPFLPRDLYFYRTDQFRVLACPDAAEGPPTRYVSRYVKTIFFYSLSALRLGSIGTFQLRLAFTLPVFLRRLALLLDWTDDSLFATTRCWGFGKGFSFASEFIYIIAEHDWLSSSSNNPVVGDVSLLYKFQLDRVEHFQWNVDPSVLILGIVRWNFYFTSRRGTLNQNCVI